MKTLNANDLNLDNDFHRTLAPMGLLASNKSYFENYTAQFMNNGNVITVEASDFGLNSFGGFVLLNSARVSLSLDTTVELKRKGA